jgi:hypothetical protein
MNVTRRQFLTISGSVAFLSLDPRTPAKRPPLSGRDSLILDLKEHCSLPESFQGYQACLADLGFHPVTVSLEMLSKLPVQARQIIAPATAAIEQAQARQLVSFLENGGSILLELGLAFVQPAIWDAQRRLFQAQLGLSIQPPVQLWPSTEVHRCVPYVDYLWPWATKVRDFSRVVPLLAQKREVIAQVQGMTVGVRRKMGKGTITVLGSPLGPVLRAGDQEARRWLGEVMSVARA